MYTYFGRPLEYQDENLDTNLIPLIEDLIMAGIPIWLYRFYPNSYLSLCLAVRNENSDEYRVEWELIYKITLNNFFNFKFIW